MTLIGGVGPAVLGLVWTLNGIACVLVGLRAYAASRRSNKWRWDFIWITMSQVAALFAAVSITKGVQNGLGNHLVELSFDDIASVLKWTYNSVYAGTLSMLFSKFAVTALLLEVQHGTQMTLKRYLLWASAIIFAITTVLEIVLTMSQCGSPSKAWLVIYPSECPRRQATETMSYVHSSKLNVCRLVSCFNQLTRAVVGGCTDIFLALFPISIVWNLHTSRRVKVGFCALMAVGIIPGVASLARVHVLRLVYQEVDVTYRIGLFMISTTIEVGSLIILGSIPPLRPLFLRVVYGVRDLKVYGMSTKGPETTHHTPHATTTNTVVIIGKAVDRPDDEKHIMVSHEIRTSELFDTYKGKK
ncbi:hypothetical protein ANO11243_085210 [Dothideomycetidae sp. 11243]|nr:hypothetical protein ANO11243_085210 [fungal sp. No.11243]